MKYKYQLLKNQTEAEKEFAKIMTRLNIRVMAQKGFYSGNGAYIVDFYIPKPYKICIEIDGNSHEGKEDYDLRRTNYLTQERPFRVVRFSNEEVFLLSDDEIQERIFNQN